MKRGDEVNKCKLIKFLVATSYYAEQSCQNVDTQKDRVIRFQHAETDYTDDSKFELTPNEKEQNLTMGGGTVPTEDFKDLDAFDISTDLPDLKDKVAFRKCGTETNDAATPMSKDCDPVQGRSLKTCVLAGGKDCTVNMRSWSRGLIGSLQAVLSKDLIMDNFKAADIYFDQEKVTLLGINNMDDSANTPSKKFTTLLDIAKVFISIMMREKFNKDLLKKHFDQEDWRSKDLKIETIEQLQLYIIDSPKVTQISLNRAMLLPASFDMYSNDPFMDAQQTKSKALDESGQGLIMKLYGLRNFCDFDASTGDQASAKDKLKEYVGDRQQTDTSKQIITLQDLPIPDI